jgi:hypothetical protein
MSCKAVGAVLAVLLEAMSAVVATGVFWGCCWSGRRSEPRTPAKP